MQGSAGRSPHGPNIAPDAPGAERAGYGAVVLERRLRDALARLNLALPASTFDDSLPQAGLAGPAIQAADAFRDQVRSLMAQATAGAAESRVLAGIRGRLLPKLISGDIRVRDAERLMGETA